MSEPLLYCNGINAETGGYMRPPATLDQIAALARCGDSTSGSAKEAKGRGGLRSGADPRILAHTGWGVIFAQNDEKANEIRAALDPLLTLRKAQVGEKFAHRYQEYMADYGFRSGTTKRRFLSDHGIGAGLVDPDQMPYYLLIVGDPETIPWEFQYELDVQYAVGRLWFETVEEYESYARNVVAAETSPRTRAKRAALFAPQHAGDPPTDLTLLHLATPLSERIEKADGWTVERAFGGDATKANFLKVLNGNGPPDLLFSAGHGLWYPNGSPDQLSRMGALVCQDWPGHGCGRGPRPSEVLSGDDVNGADLAGLVSFHFACYGAGAPSIGDFPIARTRTAPRAFVSLLPLRQLQAGALAVIGHVDSGFEYSIELPGAGKHIEAFEDFVDRLLFKGHPVGSAMENFGARYSDLSRDLGAELEEEKRGTPADDTVLAGLWTCSRDARNYVVLGDPAVRVSPPEGEP
jgi:hypothetical protein